MKKTHILKSNYKKKVMRIQLQRDDRKPNVVKTSFQTTRLKTKCIMYIPQKNKEERSLK